MREVKEPSARTLAKYGLTMKEWRATLKRQKGGCGVCGGVPDSGILHIDHEHIRGWARKPADERKLYVRGLACFTCNNVALRRGMTPDKLRAAAKYLEKYLARRP